MKRKTPLILTALFAASYLLPTLILWDADWILFKLGVLGFPIFVVQMIGWTLFGAVGQIILTTLFLGFVGWVIGRALKKFVFR